MFNECIKKLGPDINILSQNETEKIFNLFENLVPLKPWGSVDWEKINQKHIINSFDEIVSYLDHHKILGTNIPVYILWNDSSLPVIKTTIDNIVPYMQDIISVDIDTWILNPQMMYLIELHPINDNIIGMLPNKILTHI